MTKTGKLVSISGIDGAGKTTQVKLISDYFKKRKIKAIVTEKMFTYFLLKPLIKVLRKATDSPKGGPVKLNTRLLPKFWFVFAFVDVWVGYLLEIKPLLKKYKYVVADRFYIDIWANLLYYGYIPNWAFKFLIGFLPKADIYLLLTVKPNVVRKREDDFPMSYYKSQSRIYKSLPNLLSIKNIDANRKASTVFAEIKKILDTSQAP